MDTGKCSSICQMIEVEWDGTGKTVQKQSVRANTAIKDIKNLKVTLGD